MCILSVSYTHLSFAVTSCGNKKAANTEVEATEVEVVEEAQACDSVQACCKADSAAVSYTHL